MTTIRLLPDEVASKIAAGEVIERPASVVKELVDNALDAGAAEVRIELVDGGKKLIKVQDDGSGMGPEDAALCFRRHATSKIAAEADLERIATLGFRGEALASISAVSRLTLRTSDGTSGRGTMISREGERLLSVSDIAFPRGTSVEVRDLFFNLPARRKFLRSAASELGPIVKTVTQAALSAPGVRFVLVHGGRELIACPPVGSLRDRVYQLFGRKVIDGLMDVAAEEGRARLDGLSSRPLAGRADRSVQYLFVNGRPVKDRVLGAALSQAYTGLLERNRFPEAFLFLRLPFEEVDVNVHPAKSEVRFKDPQLVFRLVLRAVGEAAARGATLKDIEPAAPVGTEGRRIAEGEAGYGARGLEFGPDLMAGWTDRKSPAPASTAAVAPGPIGPSVLGQLDNMYIVAAAEDGLLVIDQHNAHERVLYERYGEVDRKKAWPRSVLLVPFVLELAPSAVASWEANAGLLEEMGFRAEPLGGRSLALKEFPEFFEPGRAAEVFLGLLEEAGPAPAEDRRERMLATLACKTAVKAGEPLTREKMAYLVEELFKTSQPALCPHGRPIVVRIDRSTIDKGLGRKGRG